MTTWQLKAFSDLSLTQLYDLLALRQNVFVVEQDCPYPDADGDDMNWLHLLGYQSGELVAYARIRPGSAEQPARIGRVVVAEKARGQQLGRQLMQESMRLVLNRDQCNEIVIGAQLYLLDFYTSLGFMSEGDDYLEDGIPHQDMRYRNDP